MKRIIKADEFDWYYNHLQNELRLSETVEMGSWQSTTAVEPALRMKELLHECFQYDLDQSLAQLRENVKPYLPWADDHFEQERMSGSPINPGTTYKEWRYPSSASAHVENFEFSHSYAERYWPQYAGLIHGGQITPEVVVENKLRPHRGIRHTYGNLNDVIDLLAQDPTTRQAYLPIFFPEDIMAARKKERIPCTLGYHFIFRNNQLDVSYYMRSCDLTRHFRDDVYLTARLAFRIFDTLVLRASQNSADPRWGESMCGNLHMYISSLHCFEDDLK